MVHEQGRATAVVETVSRGGRLRCSAAAAALAAGLLLTGGGLVGCGGNSTAEVKEAGMTAACLKDPSKCKTKEAAELRKEAVANFEEAVALYKKQGDKALPQVEAKLREALEVLPNFGKAWFNLGVVHELQGKKEEARVAYNKAFEVNPKLGAPLVNLGMMALEDGDAATAWDYFKQAEQAEPFNPQAQNNLSVMLREKGEYLEAVSHARRSLAGEPRNTKAFANLARIWYERGNYDVAKLVLINGMKIDGEKAKEEKGYQANPDLPNLMGLVALAQNNVTGAAALFQDALKIDPQHVSAHMNMGAILMNMRDYEAALKHFGTVLKLKPANLDAKVSTAVAYRAMGDLEKSRKVYDEVLKADPDNAIVQFNLGVLEQEHLAQDAMLGDDKQQTEDPVKMMEVNISNMGKAITHYEKAIQHYRNFLANDQSGNEEHRKEADRRIEQVATIIATTRSTIDQLETQKEELKVMMEQQKRLEEEEKRMAAEEAKAAAAAEAEEKKGEQPKDQQKQPEGGAEK